MLIEICNFASEKPRTPSKKSLPICIIVTNTHDLIVIILGYK